MIFQTTNSAMIVVPANRAVITQLIVAAGYTTLLPSGMLHARDEVESGITTGKQSEAEVRPVEGPNVPLLHKVAF